MSMAEGEREELRSAVAWSWAEARAQSRVRTVTARIKGRELQMREQIASLAAERELLRAERDLLRAERDLLRQRFRDMRRSRDLWRHRATLGGAKKAAPRAVPEPGKAQEPRRSGLVAGPRLSATEGDA